MTLIHHGIADPDSTVGTSALRSEHTNGELVEFDENGLADPDDDIEESLIEAHDDIERYDGDLEAGEGDDQDDEEDVDEEIEVPLDPSEYSVDELQAELATGEYDDVLYEISQLEAQGEDRTTAHEAIAARREEVSADE